MVNLRIAWHWLRCIVGRHHPDRELCGAEHHRPLGTVLTPSEEPT